MRTEKYYAGIPVKEYVEKYVNIEEFEELCKACGNYNKKWCCPPFDFDVEEYWLKYDNFYILGTKIFLDEDEHSNYDDCLAQVRQHMAKELEALEVEKNGISLFAGSCVICGESNIHCARAFGKPCRCPEGMRYSIESLGGNVGLTISKLLNLEILWIEDGKLPEYFVLVGGLLY